MNFLCGELHAVLESDLSAGHPICVIFNHNYTALSNDALITKLKNINCGPFSALGTVLSPEVHKMAIRNFCFIKKQGMEGEKELEGHYYYYYY